MDERTWPGLSAAQADGLACVICGRDYLSRPISHAPVGRSATGSQVFACAGACADTATAAGAVAIPQEAVTASGAAFGEALAAVGGDLGQAYADDVVVATLRAAAALRRLAGSQAQQWESAFGEMVALIPLADLTARADELDPRGGAR